LSSADAILAIITYITILIFKAFMTLSVTFTNVIEACVGTIAVFLILTYFAWKLLIRYIWSYARTVSQGRLLVYGTNVAREARICIIDVFGLIK